MKANLIILISLFSTAVYSDGQCIKECEAWDTFCKSPKQVITTKCRLGVPVYHEQCKELGISSRYLVRGGGSLVDGLPCTTQAVLSDDE